MTNVTRATRSRPTTRLLIGSLVAILAIAIAVLLPTAPASAQAEDPTAEELAAEGLVRLDAVNAGALLFKTTEPGWYVPAPALHTTVDVAVSGPLARTTVAQTFHNSADIFVDATYVFPLPEGAAVDTLRMRVGNRWVEGSIEGREEAREIFEQAAAAGQVASLVEQQRPNAFTTSVANIAPDAEVIIQIEYQETLPLRDGVFGLRIPLVVAPRYVPETQQEPLLVLTETGWAADPGLDADAAAVRSPLTDPRLDSAPLRNPVEIRIDLDAGFPLGDTSSAYHDVTIEAGSENTATIELNGPVPADRDFYLSWAPRDLDDPYATAFREHRENETHFVALVTPPTFEAVGDTRPAREVIFVQDTSGSMAGESIIQARAGLTMALESLDEGDTFNIIEFDSDFTRFRPAPVEVNEQNISRAIGFVRSLAADGGTSMYRPLEAALLDSTPDDGRLRQVIFLTDGAVGNEQQMLTLIEAELGASRLFTVGIGSAPNSYFMTAAARSGRGASVFIGVLDEVNEQMQTLFSKIETPAVIGLALEGLPAGAEVSPSPLPDLYAGDPIALTIRIPEFTEDEIVRLTGQRGGEDWHLEIPLTESEQRPGVSKLWAREHIRDLEALWFAPATDSDDRDQIDDQIRETALSFGLVSRLTSLVAVDVEITRPQDEDSSDTQIPTNLPDGWDPDIFLAERPDGDRSPSLELDRLANAEVAEPDAARDASGVPIPAGGAGWQLRVVLGAAMLVLGAGVLRRREDAGRRSEVGPRRPSLLGAR